MKQQPPQLPPETPAALRPASQQGEKPLDSCAMLTKLAAFGRRKRKLKRLAPTDLVWICASRSNSVGRLVECRRTREKRPPDCPLWSRTKHPLFVIPAQISFEKLQAALGKDAPSPLDPGDTPCEKDANPYRPPDPGNVWITDRNHSTGDGSAKQRPTKKP